MMHIYSLGAASRYRVNQAIPPGPTTSYDHPWPYYVVADIPALAPVLTGTSDVDLDAASGVQDIVLSTDLPTASFVQVTALPPATTLPQTVLLKLPYHRQLNVLFLVPLFVALGIASGAIAAVLILKWRENRRHVYRTPSLLPGPPYAPPENDVEDRLLVHGHPSMEEVSLYAAATPSKFTVHGSRYTHKRTFAWRNLDATRPPYPQPTYARTTIVPSSDGERFTVVTEEDPFLVISPAVTGLSPKSSDNLPQIRVSPSLPDPASGDNSSRRHTDSPKPFRRSMFDILKVKGPCRSAPSVRKEYAVIMPDEEPIDKPPVNGVSRASSLKTAVASGRRSRSPRLSLDGGFGVSGMEGALELLGLQNEKQDLADALVVSPKQTPPPQASTLSSPNQNERVKMSRKVTPYTSESKGTPKETIHSGDKSSTACGGDQTEERDHPDLYTKTPRRRSRTSLRKPSTGSASKQSSVPDTHASVLPLSPPSLMSPPLAKSLFFTTSSSSSASLASRMNTLAAAHSLSLHHVECRSPEHTLFPLPADKSKSTKKLRTKRPEPPLPYPSYPDHVHAQPTPRKRSHSADTKQRPVSPGSPKPKGRSTSAAQRESTAGIWSLGSLSQTSLAIALASSSSSDVLGKVNDILTLGYTKKRTSTGGVEDKVVANLPDSV